MKVLSLKFLRQTSGQTSGLYTLSFIHSYTCIVKIKINPQNIRKKESLIAYYSLRCFTGV